MKAHALLYVLLSLLITCLSSCGWIEGAGHSVEAVGDGAAHALDETGDAIGDAATETENTLEDAVD